MPMQFPTTAWKSIAVTVNLIAEGSFFFQFLCVLIASRLLLQIKPLEHTDAFIIKL